MRQKRQEKKQNSEIIHWLKKKDEKVAKLTHFQTIYFLIAR